MQLTRTINGVEPTISSTRVHDGAVELTIKWTFDPAKISLRQKITISGLAKMTREEMWHEPVPSLKD